MKIKKFNEKLDFSEYHPISNEDIEDLALEMIDNGFSIRIDKYFVNSNGSKTEQPIDINSRPIYDISLEKKSKSRSVEKWDGGYYYDNANVLKMFNSTLNKMKNLLDIEDALYTKMNDRYHIRLLLSKAVLSKNDVGFDLNQFSDKLYKVIDNMCVQINQYHIGSPDYYGAENGMRLHEYMVGRGNIRFQIVVNLNNEDMQNKWETSSNTNNKDSYDEIIKFILDYIKEYDKFITYDYELVNRGSSDIKEREIKTGFLKKKIQTYTRYRLEFKIVEKNN